MLPKLRRVSSILRNTNTNDSNTNANKPIQSTERLSNKSSSSSTEDGNNGEFNAINILLIKSICLVYIETLLYIVHVDDIDLPVGDTDEVAEEMYDGGDEQQSNSPNRLIRRMSKRTTASFNERHQISKAPIYARPSFTFSNPLRRLNSNDYFHPFLDLTIFSFQVSLDQMKEQHKLHRHRNLVVLKI